MRRFLPLIVVSCFFLASTCKAEPQEGARILGPGAKSCGAYLKEGKFPRLTDVWILGFLSGVNGYHALRGYDLLRDVDAEAIASWTENYCKEHPLEKILAATAVLVSELRSKKEAQEKSTK